MSFGGSPSGTLNEDLLCVRESSSSFISDQVRRHLDAILADIRTELNQFKDSAHNASVLKEALELLSAIEDDFSNADETQLRDLSSLCSKCVIPHHKTLLICALLNLKLACNNRSDRPSIEITTLSTLSEDCLQQKAPKKRPSFLERVKNSFRLKSNSRRHESFCPICGKQFTNESFTKHLELCTILNHIGETCEDEQLLRQQIIALLELYEHGLPRSEPALTTFGQLIQLLQVHTSVPELEAHLKVRISPLTGAQVKAILVLCSFVEFLKRKASLFDRKETTKKTTLDDFAVIKPISRGAFGRVYLVLHKSTGQLFALKALQKDALISQKLVRNVVRERNILALADNPFIVKCHWAFTSVDNVYMVMEYVPGGDCYSLLESVGCVGISIAKKYTAELVCALKYLHSKGIVHRDLKPDNILIGLNGHIKLTDFGLSTMGHRIKNTEMLNICLESQKSMSPLTSNSLEIRSTRDSSGQSKGSSRRVLGTPDYLSPEALNGDHTGPETDWWALGAVLFELIAGYPPFTAETVTEIFQNLIEGRIQWPTDQQDATCFTPAAVDLITKLLCLDPRQRLGHRGAWEIKNHVFFDGINWSRLLQEEAAFVPKLESDADVSYFVNKPFSQSSMAKDFETQMTPQQTSRLSLGNLVLLKDVCFVEEHSQDVHDFFSGFSFISPKKNRNAPGTA